MESLLCIRAARGNQVVDNYDPLSRTYGVSVDLKLRGAVPGA